MKKLHRQDLFAWSRFDEARDLDFHSVLWSRPGGSIIIDPLPLHPHDEAHVERLGEVAWIVITNSDHVRDAAALAARTRARLAGPRGERQGFPLVCDRWLGEGDELVPGLQVFELDGSKTPGELCLLLERTTLITGDLIRSHLGGRLDLLPDPKLTDKRRALGAVQRLAALPDVEAVIPGDGWPVFRDGQRALRELVARSGVT